MNKVCIKVRICFYLSGRQVSAFADDNNNDNNKIKKQQKKRIGMLLWL